MKKWIKIVTKVIKWITILPKILDLVEEYSTVVNNDKSKSN